MVPRAQRFPIRTAMQYRVIGEIQMYTGMVENMSATGVLFRGDQALLVDSPIEVTIDVANSLGENLNSKMVSRGRIVRVSLSESDSGVAVMAAALNRLRILRD